eukprot:TRINITY_DN26631_c0_g1_i1.p1 TRINITY_DN26631_c0_g1~~TRINITY_DN26631_c0_g1_i1.p1  ORF type:complete len:382 (-),score=75.71 TRINITY_DN26631_c0_g1_i1:141-1211(-)
MADRPVSTDLSLPPLAQADGARFTLRRIEGENASAAAAAAVSCQATAAAFEAFEAAAAELEESEDAAILKRLEALAPRRAPKLRGPGLRWDGRVSNLTLKEFREKRWGLDAGIRATLRGKPSWSMRGQLPNPLSPSFSNRQPTFQRGDVHAAVRATRYIGPSWSMGCLPALPTARAAKPGPGDYTVNSAMDPAGHPTIPKNTGQRFLSTGRGGGASAPRLGVPGPGEYEELQAASRSSVIPTRPVWSLAGREAWEPSTAASGPEPGEYDVSKVVKNGKITPNRWTMAGRLDPASDGKRMLPASLSPKARRSAGGGHAPGAARPRPALDLAAVKEAGPEAEGGEAQSTKDKDAAHHG